MKSSSFRVSCRASLVLGVLFAQVARGDVSLSKAEIKWVPLAGSEWALAHPGVLPFEECHLDTAFSDEGEIEFFLEQSSPVYPYPKFLTCTAPTLGIAYSLPIDFERREITEGVFLSVPFLGVTHFDGIAKIKNLNSRTVQESLGDFDGFKVSGGVWIAGGAGTFLKNKHGVTLDLAQFQIGNVFSLQTMRFTLSASGFVSALKCQDPFVILGQTDLRRTEAECLPDRIDGPNFYPSNPVKVESLLNLRFEKISRAGH